jgi:hypothetical protein
MNNFNDTITSSIEAGVIYNVEFGSVKDSANRAFEHAITANLRSLYFYSGKYEDRTERELAIDDAVGFALHTFPSKKLVKLMDTATRTPYVMAVEDMIAEWKPVGASLKTLKTMVVKGRKPSDTPRMTPERTIENTGTCPVCTRNIKLDGGRMVSHGYNIQYGYQSGNCFGVGHLPIEVSDTGAVAYRISLMFMVDTQNTLLLDANAAHMEAPTRKTLAAVWGIESFIRQVARDIEYFTKIINNWEAKPLPDAKD